MARLLEGRLEAWSRDGLGADEVEISHDLLHMSWVRLVFDSLAGPPGNVIEDANLSVSSYFSPMDASIQSNDAFGPEDVKSSPCTLHTMSLRACRNMHALASPLTKPSSSKRPEYSQCHPSAAALVPYKWTSSNPTMSRALPGSSGGRSP